MGNNDFSNIGEQIREAVEDAIDSMDFKQLNRTISDTMSDALSQVQRHLNVKPQNRQANQEKAPYREPSKPKPKPEIMVHPPSRVQGILMTVFGSIGLGISLTALLYMLTIALLTPSWTAAWALSILAAATSGIFAILLGTGNSIRGRIRRIRLYLQAAEDKAYCSIRELSGRTGKPEKYVIKDIKKMIRKGIFPHGHIDENQTCLMLNDETYQQYRQSMESLKLRMQQETTVPKPEADSEETTDRMSQVIKEGHEYLDTLRKANDAIPGEVISGKLYRLETLVEKIFQVIGSHPQQLDDIERFIEYYLPTTVKLVTAYRDFDNVGIRGDNITMAKQEVEQTLDTINHAFERLLDDLYQDEAFDISTDASVLQAMLKKDGFVNDDFDRPTT